MKNVVTCADKDNIGGSKGVMVVNKEKTWQVIEVKVAIKKKNAIQLLEYETMR